MTELNILYPNKTFKILHLSSVIIYAIIFTIVIAFMSLILTRFYYHKEFNHELIVKVQPRGTLHFPYYPYHHYNSTLPEELHRVKIKNNRIVHVERIGYAYQEIKQGVIK